MKVFKFEESTKVGLATGLDITCAGSIVSMILGALFGGQRCYRLLSRSSQKDTQVDLGVRGKSRYVIAPSIDWCVSDKPLLTLTFIIRMILHLVRT
ncbi:hypothetical protein O9929_26245 [Vibrio lentus]|nr:hypothetical protein [Vibrio lentus]